MNSVVLVVFYLLIAQAMAAADVRHSIVKRKAEDGKLYVFSSRQGCVKVASNKICPVNWKLNPVFAEQYEKSSKANLATLNLIIALAGTNPDCRKNIKNALCSQSTPRCLEDGSNDYGDVETSCKKIYTSCPFRLANDYKKKNFCGKLLTGKHSKSKCVFPSSPIKGVCPQPKYKMPENSLKVYQSVSESLVNSFRFIEKVKTRDGTPIYSSDCVSKIKEISCVPLYCSADEKRLLMEYDEDDCNNVVTECIEKPLSSLPSAHASTVKQLRDSAKATCKKFPDKNAQTESAPSAGCTNYFQPGFFVSSLLLVSAMFIQL